MPKKAVTKSTALPRIRIDDDSGEKYVLLGKKKVWLPHSVTNKKTLRVFLRKRRKRKAAKTKKRSKRSRKLLPRVFGEATSRLILGETALNLARAANNSSKGIDEDKLAERLERKMLALMPAKEDTSKAVVRGDAGRSRSRREDEATHAAYMGISAAEKEKNRANRERLKRKISDLKHDIGKAETKAYDEAKEALEKISHTDGVALNTFLKQRAKHYGVKGKDGGTRIDQLVVPVMLALLEDRKEKRRIPRDVVSSFDHVADLLEKRSKAKENLDNFDEQADAEPVARSSVQIDEESDIEQKYSEPDDYGTDAVISDEEEAAIIEAKTRRNAEKWAQLAAAKQRQMKEDAKAEAREMRDEKEKLLLADEYYKLKSQEKAFKNYRESALIDKERRLDAHNDRLRGDEELSRLVQQSEQLADLDEATREQKVINNKLFEIDLLADKAIAKIKKETIGYINAVGLQPDSTDWVKLHQLEQYKIGNVEALRLQEQNEFIQQQGQQGQGHVYDDGVGLSTTQINDLMHGYPDYIGCIASDEISTLHIKPHSRFGFVMNTDPHYKPGVHWVAIYVDARPGGDNSIEYYNSLVDQPTRVIFEDLKEVAQKAHPTEHLFQVKQDC